MARRGAPGRNRAPAGRPSTIAGPGRQRPVPAPSPRGVGSPSDGRAALEAQVGLALGVLAMLVLPIAYQWTLRPATNPFGGAGSVTIVELAGIAAAAVALLLGRRARVAGDRSSGAVWAPRLGAAAMVGYVMTLVLLATQGG